MQIRLTFLLFFLPFWSAQAQTIDSLEFAKPPKNHKILRMTIPPAVLIGTGLLTMHDASFYSSEDAKLTIRTAFPNFKTSADNYVMFIPLAAAYGLNAFGLESKNNFVHKSGILIGSTATMGAIVYSLKYSTAMTRPNGEPHSFPSGHTASAFVIATFLDHEFRHESVWISVGGYTVASATGMMRMLNNKHWMSDVLVGAGIGIVSTNMVYLLHDKFWGNAKISFVPAMPFGKPGFGIYASF